MKVKQKKPKKRYYVDFYDAFDGWGGLPGFHPERHYTSLAAAKREADKLHANLPQGNKRMGEHYGVINLERNIEVYCAKQYGDDRR